MLINSKGRLWWWWWLLKTKIFQCAFLLFPGCCQHCSPTFFLILGFLQYLGAPPTERLLGGRWMIGDAGSGTPNQCAQ